MATQTQIISQLEDLKHEIDDMIAVFLLALLAVAAIGFGASFLLDGTAGLFGWVVTAVWAACVLLNGFSKADALERRRRALYGQLTSLSKVIVAAREL